MLKQQSGSMHRTDLCPLLVCDNPVASSYMINSKRATVSKAFNSESRISSWYLAGFCFVTCSPYLVRTLVQPQLDGPCFGEAHERPVPFRMEIEEEWMGGGVDVKGEGGGGKKGG